MSKDKILEEVFPIVPMNRKATVQQLMDKITEEYLELLEAYKSGDIDHALEEANDLTQVSINFMREMCSRNNRGEHHVLCNHERNLEGRGVL